MKLKSSKFVQSIAIAAAIGAIPGLAQSITTILGEVPGAPSSAPALSVSLNLPSGVASDGKGNVEDVVVAQTVHCPFCRG